jgi:hypothetical protein
LLWSKIPRGGASLSIPATSDFAMTIGVLAAGDGLLATLTQELVGKLVANHLFVEGGIGGASVSMAVTLHLALTGITEVFLVYLKCWFMGANTWATNVFFAIFCVGAGAGYMLQSRNAFAGVAKILSLRRFFPLLRFFLMLSLFGVCFITCLGARVGHRMSVSVISRLLCKRATPFAHTKTRTGSGDISTDIGTATGSRRGKRLKREKAGSVKRENRQLEC